LFSQRVELPQSIIYISKYGIGRWWRSITLNLGVPLDKYPTRFESLEKEKNFWAQSKERYAVNILYNYGTAMPDVW
jgi:hypothetical protein